MNYFIGIDPSINSTGLCIQKYDGDEKVSEYFVIVKPADNKKDESKWLSKKEQHAEESIYSLQYCFYTHYDISKENDDAHQSEYAKSQNLISCAKTIKEIVRRYTNDNAENIYIVIEGISYGSVKRTKSIFDLAGLNYLIREKFIIPDSRYVFTIVTPSEIKKFASGNGNCNKDIMVSLFTTIHPSYQIVPKLDDISDAFFMSNYAKEIYEKREK